MKKDVVAGIGEIGKPILKLLSKQNITVGFDLKPDLMNQRIFEKYKNLKTSFLHIAIPATSRFSKNVLKLSKKFQPECIVIHSTIKPGTTAELQAKLSIPVTLCPFDSILNIVGNPKYPSIPKISTFIILLQF